MEPGEHVVMHLDGGEPEDAVFLRMEGKAAILALSDDGVPVHGVRLMRIDPTRVRPAADPNGEGPPRPKYRVGMSNGHTIYEQYGDDPMKHDPFVGSCTSPAAAATLVARANGEL